MDVGHQHQIDPVDPSSVAEKKQSHRMAVWTVRHSVASEADEYHSSRLSQAQGWLMNTQAKPRTFTHSGPCHRLRSKAWRGRYSDSWTVKSEVIPNACLSRPRMTSAAYPRSRSITTIIALLVQAVDKGRHGAERTSGPTCLLESA